MNKPSKCKNCQWYGKPYWSIVNPCDNCPMENVETFTRWVDPTIAEKDKEIEKLYNIIGEIKEKIDDYFAYDYENESMARLDVINEINRIIVEVKEGK